MNHVKMTAMLYALRKKNISKPSDATKKQEMPTVLLAGEVDGGEEADGCPMIRHCPDSRCSSMDGTKILTGVGSNLTRWFLGTVSSSPFALVKSNQSSSFELDQQLSKAPGEIILINLLLLLVGGNGMCRSLGQTNRYLEAVIIGDLLHKTVDLGFRSRKAGRSSHGTLHELSLNLHGLDDRTHRLSNDLHLRLCIESCDDRVKAGGESKVIHLLAALADRVLSVDSSTIHVSLFDRLLDLKLLSLFLLLTLARLPLKALRGELQLHDLVHQLLCVPHSYLVLSSSKSSAYASEEKFEGETQ
ncbi:hypothetical protein M5K25_013927 [Dendrobium thyrsiflorum]|uniref:Uncharacterized protein n=1 Tax=Dendrobium thyrsiflorum TaxID=117978 RepID=A0ABD0UV26_DENTH